MASNTLNDRSDGQIIVQAFFNDIHLALDGDFVGRNASGVPASGQNLGTAAIPWGTFRGTGLVISGSSIDVTQVSAPPFSVVSGKVRTTSNQPQFLTPNGAAASFIVDGTSPSLVYRVNGSSVTLSADLTKSGLSAAPSANNTCLVDDTLAIDQEATRTWGELYAQKDITVDTMGSSISALVGTYQAFKINDGSNDEYFYAFVESTTKLSRIYRGFYYNSSLAPVNRIKFANNDTITLMKAHYVFLDSDGTTVDTTTTAPAVQDAAPSSPATGDYWYDLPNNLWKRYDGASFATVNRTYIGMVLMDTTNCVAARCVDYDKRYKSDNNISLKVSTTEIIRGDYTFQKTHVAGQEINFLTDVPEWNITTDLASSADMYSATEQASTQYYLYLSDTGVTVVSDISPYYEPSKFGWYHPHNTWRRVGYAFNNASSNLVSVTGWDTRFELEWTAGNGRGSTNTGVRRYTNEAIVTGSDITAVDSATNGLLFTVREYGWYSFYIQDRGSPSPEAGLLVNGDATELTQAPSANTTSTTRNKGFWQQGAGAATIGTFEVELFPGDVCAVNVSTSNTDTTAVQSRVRVMKIRGPGM